MYSLQLSGNYVNWSVYICTSKAFVAAKNGLLGFTGAGGLGASRDSQSELKRSDLTGGAAVDGMVPEKRCWCTSLVGDGWRTAAVVGGCQCWCWGPREAVRRWLSGGARRPLGTALQGTRLVTLTIVLIWTTGHYYMVTYCAKLWLMYSKLLITPRWCKW